MKATLVHVHVKAEHADEFLEATRKNHEGSVREAGNHRFDILRSREDPTRFILYEVFENDDAIAAHKETAHYLEWRETVADWMAEPRHAEIFDLDRPLLGSD